MLNSAGVGGAINNLGCKGEILFFKYVFVHKKEEREKKKTKIGIGCGKKI